MVAQCRYINACFTDYSQDIFFIGKFNFSTVNGHCTHNRSSLLRFHINCIKVTVILTCTALDAAVVINMIRMLDLSGDRSGRTVLGALAASDTELFINVELAKGCTNLCTAFFIPDMFLIFIRSASEC